MHPWLSSWLWGMTMKCVQCMHIGPGHGETRRVSDEQAILLCGGILQAKGAKWRYISKDEFRNSKPTKKDGSR